jgi:flagellar basal body-associated protein FliL
MTNIIMLIALIIVVASSVGIYFWFSRRLNAIEDELWGQKRKEAEETAMSETGTETPPAAESPTKE